MRRKSKAYKQMIKRHVKNLKKINYECNKYPWCSWPAFTYLIEFMRYMKDYYELHENVWSAEDTPSRLETLTECLGYYDKWMSLEDEYIKVIDTPETYKEQKNPDGTVTILDIGCRFEYKCGSQEKTYEELSKMQAKYRKLFFDCLEKNLESWVD